MSEHQDIINTLASTFGRYGWDDRALSGYLLALSDLPADLLRVAAARALRTADKMPTPAELRKEALAATTPDRPGPDEAWSATRAAMGRHGRDNRPAFDEPAIDQTIDYLGGWSRLCTSNDQTGDRIAFVRTYQAITARASRSALLATGLDPTTELTAGTRHQLPAAIEQLSKRMEAP